ncbi:F-box/kelch-repeat protein At3g23880-like [Vicia villosa]|uniref:F-box/kelch-repeat protein At3g23880-like n=1 Tax=Vicia villosa TaxID=3911 RepID=UPI00273AE8FD|nr:F-box/kelch-repeat protein At3g23880-like [Vicia villosa]
MYGSFIGFDYERGVIPYSVNSLLDNPSFDFSVDSYYLVQDKGCSNIVGSCNGLICLVGEYNTYEYYEYLFRLWNPATGTTSPKFGFLGSLHDPPAGPVSRYDCCYKFTFGCDNSTSTYKLVASSYDAHAHRSYVRILSFGDNVWRNIQSFPVDPLYSDLSYQYYGDVSVYFKSTINWLAIQNHLCYDSTNIEDISIEQFVIVSLDLRTETYNQYLLPPEFDQVPTVAPIISVLGDCLSFSYCYNETHLIIWQMKKFGVQNSWTKFLKISYCNFQIHYDYSNEDIEGNEDIEYNFELRPLFLSKDGDTLVLNNIIQECQTILYNWRNDIVERTKITATTIITCDSTVHNASCTAYDYIESLVSVSGK